MEREGGERRGEEKGGHSGGIVHQEGRGVCSKGGGGLFERV